MGVLVPRLFPSHRVSVERLRAAAPERESRGCRSAAVVAARPMGLLDRSSSRPARSRGAGMRVVSVNIGLPREVAFRGGGVMTGIYKSPVKGAIAVRRLN